VTTTHRGTDVNDVARRWWIPLITGILWLIVALVLLRFDEASVTTTGILAGITFIAAGINDLALAGTAERGRWLYLILACFLIPVGVIALFSPGNTFEALAAIIGWYLLIKGGFDVVNALMNRSAELWGVGLVIGLVEILLAFWAAGYFGRKAFLLIIWVASAALTRGILQITLAFQLRRAGEASSLGGEHRVPPAAPV
jgi:uncharacterized membrane protein HdeD (DUF308 family)